MVQSLLTRGRVPKVFWPEAINWSIHILNRSPILALQDVTLEEAWSERRPAVDHFRIFWCIAYAQVSEERRKKLDDRGEKCIFLGVSKASKAYKLFNPLTKKIVTSRDVVFDEENIWDWNKQQPSQVLYDNEVEETTPTSQIPANTTPTVTEILPTTRGNTNAVTRV